MSERKNEPIGIKKIADVLGVSIGTVDRALHNRPGVSPKTRDKILRLVEKLNYTPNLAARNLKLNRHLRIGVFLPEQIAIFYDQLREGIREAAAQAGHGSKGDVLFHSYPKLGEGDIEALNAANWREYDGIILAPGDPAKISSFSLQAAEANIPIVYVTTDAPRTQRLASIAIEGTVSGGIAAELLGAILPAGASVAAIVGDLRIQDHAEKLRGFAAGLATLSPHLQLLSAIESHESVKDAHSGALQLVKQHRDIGGIYVTTANSLPVLHALQESRRLGSIRVITTDLFPEIIAAIEAGHVFASVYQRPFMQGKMAFEALSRFLTARSQPEQIIRLKPHIVFRSNLSLFVETNSLS